MPGDTSLTAAQPMSDRPRRTWRLWWKELPGYYRIGVWTVLAVVGLHVAVTIRFSLGLQEPAEITALRKRGRVRYFWEKPWGDPFPGYHWLSSGLWGRSFANVNFIDLSDTGTDADLADIGSRFRYLKALFFDRTEISREGLRSLQGCQRLECVSFEDTDLGDSDVEYMLNTWRLKSISLNGTRITNALQYALYRQPDLLYVRADGTQLTDSIPDEILDESEDFVPQVITIYHPEGMVASIRWADGRVCERFQGSMALLIHDLTSSTNEGDSNRKFYHPGRTELCEAIYEYCFHRRSPVNLRLQLTLEANGFKSEPVLITIKDDKPTVREVEFRMPVTREHALRD